ERLAEVTARLKHTHGRFDGVNAFADGTCKVAGRKLGRGRSQVFSAAREPRLLEIREGLSDRSSVRFRSDRAEHLVVDHAIGSTAILKDRVDPAAELVPWLLLKHELKPTVNVSISAFHEDVL